MYHDIPCEEMHDALGMLSRVGDDDLRTKRLNFMHKKGNFVNDIKFMNCNFKINRL